MAERGDESLVHTLKKVAAVLKQSEIPFALGGSFAVYAHGGHSSDHDVDFLIREVDVEQALEALVAAGFVAERRPEDWLVKVFDDGRMVDLIHRPIETPVTEETLADTVIRPVDAIHMPVLSATQLMVHKLLQLLPALLRLRPRPAAGPLAAGADRLGAGTQGDGALAVRRGVPGAAGPAGGGAGRRHPDRRGDIVTRTRHGAGPPDEYVEAEIQRLLAEDPAVAEQGITVVRRERAIVLYGEVESPHRREEILRRVSERFPDVPITSDIGRDPRRGAHGDRATALREVPW